MPGRARSVGTNTALYADDSLVTLTASVTVEIPTAGSLPIDWAVKVRAKAGASTLVGPLGKLALAVGQTADIFASDGEVVADLGGTTTVLARTGSTAEEGLDQLLSLQAAVDARLGRLHRTRALHDRVPPQNRAVRQSSPASAKPRSWNNLIRSSDRWERASSRSACHANSHGRAIYYKCSKFTLRRPALAAPRVQEQHARSAAARSDVDEQTSPLLPFASSRTVPLALAARPPDRALDVLVAEAGQLADITAVAAGADQKPPEAPRQDSAQLE